MVYSCDGSACVEFYIGVDQTLLEECAGCANCSEDYAAELAADEALAQLESLREAIPVWAGTPEIEETESELEIARRQPPQREIAAYNIPAIRRIA